MNASTFTSNNPACPRNLRDADHCVGANLECHFRNQAKRLRMAFTHPID